MPSIALYLGESCPPNMEAYLDSLLYRTDDRRFDLLVTDDCNVPGWIHANSRFVVRSHSIEDRSGIGRIRTARNVVNQHLESDHATEVRQITQPRWHAPGVILGVRSASGSREDSIQTCTRTSASMFREYRAAPSTLKAWLVNNGIGRSVFLSDRVFTPKYGGVSVPWWSSTERVVESRTVNEDRFHPDTESNDEVFSTSTNRVLTVGRISRQKGIDLVLAVAERLPNWEFAVVGPASDTSLADDARERHNVSVMDPVEYVEMPGLYAACDVVLSASRIEWGGVSRAMLEGRASGKPVVAIDNKQASDVADEVVADDVDQIVSGLKNCL